MDQDGFLGLPAPVVVAFVALLLLLMLVAHVLHDMRKPVVVRGRATDEGRRQQDAG